MTDRPPEPEDPGVWTRVDAVVSRPETANAPRPAEFAVGQLIPDDPEPPIAAAAIGLGAAPNTVTVSRRALMVGAGVAGFVIVVLFFLWRSADGDDGSTAASGDDTAEMVDRDADADGSSAAGVDDAGVSATEDELAVLGGRIGELEAELAAMRPPALAGSAMRRIVVAADASFVSLGNQGLAIIGPFGGYAAVDPATNAVTATAQVASGATRVMRTESAVWITNATGNQIVRVDAVANAVRSVFDFPSPDGIAKLGPTLVVASFDGGFVAQVDPANGEVLNELDVLGGPGDIWVNDSEDWIWVALVDSGEVVKIDAETFEVADSVTVGAGPNGLTGDDGILWVANDIEGTVVGVDMDSVEVVASIAVGERPTAAAIYQNHLWVSVTGAGELVQIDRETGEVITRTPLGSSNRGGPSGMTAGAGSLWVAMQGERSVVRITVGE